MNWRKIQFSVAFVAVQPASLSFILMRVISFSLTACKHGAIVSLIIPIISTFFVRDQNFYRFIFICFVPRVRCSCAHANSLAKKKTIIISVFNTDIRDFGVVLLKRNAIILPFSILFLQFFFHVRSLLRLFDSIYGARCAPFSSCSRTPKWAACEIEMGAIAMARNIDVNATNVNK